MYTAPTLDVKHSLHVSDRLANVPYKFPSNYFKTTKYTLLTFLPKNLFQQFHRWANFYFLLSAAISFIPNISPISWAASTIPLLFVLGVSAIKEAIEDYRRYREDERVNNLPMEVIVGAIAVTIPSREIQCGDIVKVKNGQMIPADLVLMASSHPEGVAYVNTANLDGETNLKLRKARSETIPVNMHMLRGRLECDAPNPRLYEFTGVLNLPKGTPYAATNRTTTETSSADQVVSLNERQLLLRGANLRNTDYVYGVCVYSGEHTKMHRNLKSSSNKMSHLERMLNKFVLVIFALHVAAIACSAIVATAFQINYAQYAWYLDQSAATAVLTGATRILTFLVLYNTMIPISLYVSVEIVRVAQALFMEWDLKMVSYRDTKDETAMIVRNSNVNEELGQVSYIFTDKTGTLTQNLMRFHSASIAGTVFDESATPGQLGRNMKGGTPEADAIREYLLLMAVCNGVVPNIDAGSGVITYEAQSPDEVALAEASAVNNVVIKQRNTAANIDLVTIQIHGQPIVVRVTDVLDFTSDRKRMSVICEMPDGKIKLYTKGADDIMMRRIVPDHPLRDVTRQHLDLFSKKGFRTLVFASRDLQVEEAEEWRRAFKSASDIVGEQRNIAVAEVCDKLEHSFQLVGVSAVEDKLQDEVPETLEYLLKCGIKIWILTGDKQETAVNIGLTSNLITEDMQIIYLNAAGSRQACATEIDRILKTYIDSGAVLTKPHCLVVDGATLHRAMDPPRPKSLNLKPGQAPPKILVNELTEPLFRIVSSIGSVVCCRTTPMQKAQIVRMVKQRTAGICLSIGDGANDVSMIKEAHVGVGVQGREGTQAARAADYAIGEFKHLRRLCSVHGRYSYLRLSSFVQYFFYKNLAFTLCQLWFAIYSGFSGQTLYDQWIISTYNIIFTGLPPLFLGIFEKDVSDVTIRLVPELYKRNQTNVQFNLKTFSLWVVNAIYHSVVIFFVFKALLDSDILVKTGWTPGLWIFGTMCSTTAIVIVNCKIALISRYWTGLNHFGIWGSILMYFVTMSFYNLSYSFSPTFYMSFFSALSLPSFWLGMLLVLGFCFLPDFACKFYARAYRPTDCQIYQEREQLTQVRRETSHPMRSTMSIRNRDSAPSDVMQESLLRDETL
eukprot:TRINITY_DN2532_c0_g2_i1.p1 TRINITY_DN2532_c0_g2~~TRINITY_DN2532_c0_g2_i1.p1  ORF type:complete len:1126 (-),score=220.66 TRINITY_DN2532_c0_g2_i1:130-3507(-)